MEITVNKSSVPLHFSKNSRSKIFNVKKKLTVRVEPPLTKLRSSLPPTTAVRLVATPFRSADHGLPPDSENTPSPTLSSTASCGRWSGSDEPSPTSSAASGQSASSAQLLRLDCPLGPRPRLLPRHLGMLKVKKKPRSDFVEREERERERTWKREI